MVFCLSQMRPLPPFTEPLAPFKAMLLAVKVMEGEVADPPVAESTERAERVRVLVEPVPPGLMERVPLPAFTSVASRLLWLTVMPAPVVARLMAALLVEIPPTPSME